MIFIRWDVVIKSCFGNNNPNSTVQTLRVCINGVVEMLPLVNDEKRKCRLRKLST
ncbi:MAG TPA: hypothetical protein VEV87_01025 [Chitinophagaceae bacterium]|nr:hypothetical protein [Chitinophagaceae bacterium]